MTAPSLTGYPRSHGRYFFFHRQLAQRRHDDFTDTSAINRRLHRGLLLHCGRSHPSRAHPRRRNGRRGRLDIRQRSHLRPVGLATPPTRRTLCFVRCASGKVGGLLRQRLEHGEPRRIRDHDATRPGPPRADTTLSWAHSGGFKWSMQRGTPAYRPAWPTRGPCAGAC